MTLEQERIKAAYELGEFYSERNNTTKATEWYEKAASQGHVESQYKLGELLLLSDDEKSFYWYEKAAKQGHAKSQYYCGSKYERGSKVEKNYITAYNWYQKASEQEFIADSPYDKLNGIAEYKAGEMCYKQAMKYHDDNDNKNFIKWLNKASDKNNTEAHLELGNIYRHGKFNEKQDVKKAIKFYLKADESIKYFYKKVDINYVDNSTNIILKEMFANGEIDELPV